jgi:GNAT superfamily N-acetyltransferase
VIRAARPSDYRKLADIERRAGELFREVGMPEIADDEPSDADELASATAVFIATDEAGEPIGFAMVELVDDHAHLEEVCVVPEHGGQGVGTELLDAVAGWAKGQGHGEVTLTTFRDVPFNAPLYAKRGFTIVPENEWTDDLRAVVTREADHGLDTTKRVVMRRTLQ